MYNNSKIGNVNEPEGFMKSGEDVPGSIVSESCISHTTKRYIEQCCYSNGIHRRFLHRFIFWWGRFYSILQEKKSCYLIHNHMQKKFKKMFVFGNIIHGMHT